MHFFCNGDVQEIAELKNLSAFPFLFSAVYHPFLLGNSTCFFCLYLEILRQLKLPDFELLAIWAFFWNIWLKIEVPKILRPIKVNKKQRYLRRRFAQSSYDGIEFTIIHAPLYVLDIHLLFVFISMCECAAFYQFLESTRILENSSDKKNEALVWWLYDRL